MNVDSACVTLNKAIEGLRQTLKLDASVVNQESLRGLLASFKSLGCTGSETDDEFVSELETNLCRRRSMLHICD